MTDRETLVAMFQRAGVVMKETEKGFEVYAKDGPHNVGYAGFLADFEFDEAGALKAVGAWE